MVIRDRLGGVPGRAADDLASEAILARPGGPGGPRAAAVLAAVTTYLSSRKACRVPLSVPRRTREGEKPLLGADKGGGSTLTTTHKRRSPATQEPTTPDAGRTGACVVGGDGAGRAGAEAVAVGQHAAAENPEVVKPPRGPVRNTRSANPATKCIFKPENLSA